MAQFRMTKSTASYADTLAATAILLAAGCTANGQPKRPKAPKLAPKVRTPKVPKDHKPKPTKVAKGKHDAAGFFMASLAAGEARKARTFLVAAMPRD